MKLLTLETAAQMAGLKPATMNDQIHNALLAERNALMEAAKLMALAAERIESPSDRIAVHSNAALLKRMADERDRRIEKMLNS
jgi:hypothetical protein